MRRPLKPEEVIASPRLRALLSRRRNRRLLVLSGNLCYLALLGLITRETWPPLLLLPLLLLLTLAVCAHGVLLNVGTQLVAANRVHDLDERQREVWRRAHHRAYRLLVAVVSSALLYLGLAATTGALWLPESFAGWLVVALAFWGFMVTLPSDIVYWLEPDPVGDEPARVRQEAR